MTVRAREIEREHGTVSNEGPEEVSAVSNAIVSLEVDDQDATSLWLATAALVQWLCPDEFTIGLTLGGCCLFSISDF